MFLFISPKINPQFLNLSVEISILLSRNAREFPTPGTAYFCNNTKKKKKKSNLQYT